MNYLHTIKDGVAGKLFIFMVLLLISVRGNSFSMPEEASMVNDDESTAAWALVPEIDSEQKAWTRWWWMGNAVTKEGITWHLEKMAEANFGGVEISPIYGVEGYEEASVAYLSDEWMELLVHTINEAERLGMKVDMILGTGWPFGGSHVSVEDAARRLEIRTYRLRGGQTLDHQVMQVNRRNAAVAPLHALMAYSSNGVSVDLTGYVDDQGYLDWVPDEDSENWQLIAFFNDWTNQQVKRAAPGEEGHVMDHFSETAFSNYVERYNEAFRDLDPGMIRSFFNDSYEVERANWTHDFFEEFENFRGYDLREYLPAFLGMTEEGTDDNGRFISAREMRQRIRADFHETIHDLALNRFVIPWVNWSNELGSLSRNQAHGFPANILDIYGAADIPEMEIFGQSRFRIPGLRTHPDVSHRIDSPNPLVLKFASSAAHVEGRDFTGSETATWLDEHFMVSLAQLRPHVDMQFISGINHTFYHGTTYSPPNEKWPGWKFYASTHFAPANTFWDDLGDFNRYLANSQAFLQEGNPGNDVLLYFPVHDLWQADTRNAGEPYFIRYHNPDDWFYDTNLGDLAEILWDKGYAFDYISDRQIQGLRLEDSLLKTGNAGYKTVVIPKVNYMPPETAQHLYEIAEQGGTVIFKGRLPLSVPGFHDLAERERQLVSLFRDLEFRPAGVQGILVADVGDGQILKGESARHMLEISGVQREKLVDEGLDYIRRRHDDGHIYFISNLYGEPVNNWVPLATGDRDVILYDPLTEKSGRALKRQNAEGDTEVYLQIKSGESIILKTFRSMDEEVADWNYPQVSGPAVPVEGTWQVRFEDGGPVIPDAFETDQLISWTDIGESDARRFAGSAVYSLEFQVPESDAELWKLDLGRVGESALVYLNGNKIASVWSHPFETVIDSGMLNSGENTLEIRVTNLMINRIIDMDRRGIRWQKFYDINMVNINYRPFDASGWEPMESGLLGPVTLTPMIINNEV